MESSNFKITLLGLLMFFLLNILNAQNKVDLAQIEEFVNHTMGG